MADFTHFDAEGKAVMVDVSDKEVTERIAEAKGSVLMQPATLRMIRDGGVKKGDMLAVARLAGIMGAKRTPRSEEHTSELQSLMRISYAVFCLKKKNNNTATTQTR